MVKRRHFLVFALSIILCIASLSPAFSAEELRNAFDSSLAKRPEVGEWLEYRIAYPVDPLENSLRTDPAPVPLDNASQGEEPAGAADDAFFSSFKPSFEPPASWRVLPLRLEILGTNGDGTKALLTFEGISREVVLPSGGREAADFHYDAPQKPDERTTVLIGGVATEVEVVRRQAENYGFVRYFSAEVPFGVVRFATGNVDLILVGLGKTPPPAFPLDTDPVQPPPGLLYRGFEGQ